MITSLRLFEVLGYLAGASLLFYLARVMTRRERREPGERPLLALVIATGLFHTGNFISTATTLLAGRRLPVIQQPAELVSFTCLALLPALLYHTHLSQAAAELKLSVPRITVFARWLAVLGYAPLALLPIAAVRLSGNPHLHALAKLRGFETAFVIWIVLTLVVCALIDVYLARRATAPDIGKLYRAVAAAFVINAALFSVTFLLGARRIAGMGRALETISMLSSVSPALVFAYFIYRHNYLGLIIRRSVVLGLSAWLGLLAYLFLIREISTQLQTLYGLDARFVESILILTFALVLLAFMGRLRELVSRTVFPEITRQRELARQLGRQLGAIGDRPTVARHVEAALRAAFDFDPADVLLRGEDEPLLRLVSGVEHILVLEEVRDAALRDLMEKRGYRCVVPLADGAIALGRSTRWPIWSANDALPLRELADRVDEALDHANVVEANVQLERSMQRESHLAILGRLAATVAHEIKNPLGAIKAVVQVMREQEQQPDRQLDLTMISGEIDRLAATLNQLLDFSRVGSENSRSADFATGPGSVSEAIARLVSLFRAEAQTRNVSLEVMGLDSRNGTSPVSLATTDLTQVLSNLVLNAIQAGASRVIISVSPGSGSPPAYLELTVADTGPGIPEELRDRVFEPFETTRQRGTGLGLAIVRQRVERAGGSIRLETPPEGGARFVIELPIVRGDIDVPST